MCRLPAEQKHSWFLETFAENSQILLEVVRSKEYNSKTLRAPWSWRRRGFITTPFTSSFHPLLMQKQWAAFGRKKEEIAEKVFSFVDEPTAFFLMTECLVTSTSDNSTKDTNKHCAKRRNCKRKHRTLRYFDAAYKNTRRAVMRFISVHF